MPAHMNITGSYGTCSIPFLTHFLTPPLEEQTRDEPEEELVR